jgi:hypothetical protein
MRYRLVQLQLLSIEWMARLPVKIAGVNLPGS